MRFISGVPYFEKAKERIQGEQESAAECLLRQRRLSFPAHARGLPGPGRGGRSFHWGLRPGRLFSATDQVKVCLQIREVSM